jgi:hypothetical protein
VFTPIWQAGLHKRILSPLNGNFSTKLLYIYRLVVGTFGLTAHQVCRLLLALLAVTHRNAAHWQCAHIHGLLAPSCCCKLAGTCLYLLAPAESCLMKCNLHFDDGLDQPAGLFLHQVLNAARGHFHRPPSLQTHLPGACCSGGSTAQACPQGLLASACCCKQPTVGTSICIMRPDRRPTTASPSTN